jgi:FkbH-like protein
MSNVEPIRLVIWDLDETLWRGTLTEGGITEHVETHYEIVRELGRRGIVSSICSKNDPSQVRAILETQGMWDWFVFPSISWESKGPRIARIIEAIQLRAPTVLFIDDNPNNLAEALSFTPGLRVASNLCIAGLLIDPLCQGKNDQELTRLKQYKVLEQRQADADAASRSGSNIEFLRNCGITVQIQHDVVSHIDRAVELINRTNQLNFTKNRLPEDALLAKAKLLAKIEHWNVQSGLVHVSDQYGDYGYAGFYLMWFENGLWTMEHFCFSCRVLGMGVESWLYQLLERPKLKIIGDVLSDPATSAPVDWISLGNSGFTDAKQIRSAATIPEVRLKGGCELDILGHFFRADAGCVMLETNRPRDPFLIRQDMSCHLVHSVRGDLLDIAHDLPGTALTDSDIASNFFNNTSDASLLVYSNWADLWVHYYPHRETDKLLSVPLSISGIPDIRQTTDVEFEELFASGRLKSAARQQLSALRTGLRSSFKQATHLKTSSIIEDLKIIISIAPTNALLVLLLPCTSKMGNNGRVQRPATVRYVEAARLLDLPHNVRHILMDDLILSDEDLEPEKFDHFRRDVYFRLYRALIAAYSAWRIETGTISVA